MTREDSNSRPQLLFVAYDFPPRVSAGIYRTAAITRYLRRFGWDVTVVTAREDRGGDRRQSEGLVDDETEVVRTRSFEYHRVRDRVWNSLGAHEQNPLLATNESISFGRSVGRRVMRALKLPLRWMDRFLTFPDKHVGWFFPLLFTAAGLLSRRDYPIVMSSSPPHSSQLPVLLMKRMFTFRWVVDFRDPWNAPPRNINCTVAPKLHRWLEARVLSSCDVVIANTPGNKLELEREFAGIVDGKVVVVTNGFDPKFYGGNSASPIRDVDLDCDLVYTGHLYGPMFRKYHSAVKIIRESGKPIPRLHIFGPPLERSVAAQIHNDGLEEYIVHQGALTHEETMVVVQRAPALLLLLPAGALFKYWVPSKLYTYLYSDTPILALVSEGDAADIVEKTGTGAAVTSSDPVVIAETILSFVESSRSGGARLNINRAEVLEYSWETLGRRFDELLRSQLLKGTAPVAESLRRPVGTSSDPRRR